jgi:hypothetical protein
MANLRARTIFTGSTLSLIAVESVDSWYRKTRSGCRVCGKVEPIAVIVCGPNGNYALDMQAKPADLEQLRKELPDLDVERNRDG